MNWKEQYELLKTDYEKLFRQYQDLWRKYSLMLDEINKDKIQSKIHDFTEEDRV